MAQGFDDTCYTRTQSLGNKQAISDDMKKVAKREKNRVAAQKSRMRQTQKADSLHREAENLERENDLLRREVKELTEEAKHLCAMLTQHEHVCSMLGPAPSGLFYSSHFKALQQLRVPSPCNQL